ncbi:MAG: hypothetical protein JNJ50_02125, partial [Acidobacteria bacterium]|nr:hypothetical protein [Acidobacteriota bacterium]
MFYPIYTSSATSPALQNTRINITNADTRKSAYVHLFFVDGSNCNVADLFVCLTENQTASFVAAEFDPGTTGFVIAVAVDQRGCPTIFNALMGDEYVKFATGHQANLTADAAAALNGLQISPPCDDNSFLANLRFDG